MTKAGGWRKAQSSWWEGGTRFRHSVRPALCPSGTCPSFHPPSSGIPILCATHVAYFPDAPPSFVQWGPNQLHARVILRAFEDMSS